MQYNMHITYYYYVIVELSTTPTKDDGNEFWLAYTLQINRCDRTRVTTYIEYIYNQIVQRVNDGK